MPTSSQSQILSVVDYQLIQRQQQTGVYNRTTKSVVRPSIQRTPGFSQDQGHERDDARPSINKEAADEQQSSPPPLAPQLITRRRSSDKFSDGGLSTARASQRSDLLHMPIINLNEMSRNGVRRLSNLAASKVNQQNLRQTQIASADDRSKSTWTNEPLLSRAYRRNSLSSIPDETSRRAYQATAQAAFSTRLHDRQNISFMSDVDHEIDESNDDGNENDDEDEDGGGDNNNNNTVDQKRRSSLLDDNARRLLLLGTIRPSKTFYKNLPEADVDHLMNYFRRMKTSNQTVSSEELNEELATTNAEYKSKIFFDSTCVTQIQVDSVEKLIEPYAAQLRSEEAEFVKLDNPIRFAIRQTDNELPLATIPREYNDCLITLVTQTDPLRKSKLVTELVREKFCEDVKTSSLDISYFPGGVNYDVPRDEISESGQMAIQTYQKLKKRLNNRKVRHFHSPPEKKPNALLATIPADAPILIDHSCLLDALHAHLRTSPANEQVSSEQRILSMEFLPLSCILNSNDISNQFIVDCDSMATKKQLMGRPLKIVSVKQTVTIELQSYDESMQREYDKFIKSEKYRELIRNHDNAVQRAPTKKKQT